MFEFLVTDWGSAEHITWHELIPGAKRFGSKLWAGENCAWLVRVELAKADATFTERDRRVKIKATWPASLREQIQGKPIRDWLMPHQKDGIRFAVTRQGSMLLHAPGAGKTASAIIWSAFDENGKTLWVTRAISKISHAQAIADLTTCKTQILWGEGPSMLEIKTYLRKGRLAKNATWELGGLRRGVDAQGEAVVHTTEPGKYKLHFSIPEREITTVPIELRKDSVVRVVVNFNADLDAFPSYTFTTSPVIDPAAQFIIINWEILTYWQERLRQHGFTSVVFDECHKAKAASRFIAAYEPKTNTTRFVPKNNISYAAMMVAKHAKRRLGTTGTAVKDRIRDLWAQLDLLEPNQWGSRKDWMTRYANRHVNDYGGIDDTGSSNLAELKARVKLSMHRASVSETHKNLPPLRRETIYIPASEQTSISAREIARELAGQGPLEAAIAIAASRKRASVYELIEEPIKNGQHVAVFTNRRSDAKDLADRVAKRVKNCPMILIHGGIPVGPKREDLRTAYMRAKGAAVLIATGDSMGEAIDLNRTDLAIMAQLPYTWTQLDQWEKRFWRLGSDRPVRIIYPIAQGTIDERIVSVLLTKLPPTQAITENADLGAMRQALLGGKTDDEIQKDLVDFLLKEVA